MSGLEWMLLLSQMPAGPSGIRVMLWRRMRAAGAVSLHNGVWALPSSPRNEQFIKEILAYVHEHGGTATIFVARAQTPEVEAGLIGEFSKNIGQDYVKFIDECQGFLAELETEIRQEQFTFAELEENEAELQKLTGWLRKIRARDYPGNAKAQEAGSALESCRQLLRAFARSVYVNEGMDVPENEIEYREENVVED
jgi:Protein ChrB, N-terminal